MEPRNRYQKPGLDPGLYEELTDSEYDELDALRATAVKKLDQSIDHWLSYLEDDSTASKAQQLGTLIHMAVLEPNRWEREVIGRPDPPVDVSEMSSTDVTLAEKVAEADDGRPSFDDAAEACGIQPSTAERRLTDQADERGILELGEYIREYGTPPDEELVEEAASIAEKVRQHPRVRGGLLQGGTPEVSMLWESAFYDGLFGKARPDYLYPDGLMVDLKTTSRSIGYWKRRLIWQRKYHLQAGWYAYGHEMAIGTEVDTYLYVVAQTTEPYSVRAFHLSESGLEAGRDRAIEAVERFRSFQRNPDQWTGLDPSIETLDCPRWAR
jgi:hypothetical protein